MSESVGPALTERCPTCERETPRNVRIEILAESEKPENAKFSREPYRVSECDLCGETVARRLNRA